MLRFSFRSNTPQMISMPTLMGLVSTKSLLALAVITGPSTVLGSDAESGKLNIEEVSVYGRQDNTQSSTGSRIDLTIMETPATVDIIDGESIRDRLDFTVLEAVTRSAGFSNEANPGNGGQSIAARGFRGQGAVTKLYDGSNYFTAAGTITFPFDTWGVERIEILKGPSSVLYGEGGIGGAINVIPKIPEQEDSGQLRVTAGEDNTTFYGVGLTGDLTDNMAYRVDFSNRQSDNWIDNSGSESEMLSLALSWLASEDLSLSLRYDYGDQKPMKYFGIPVVNGDFAHEYLESNFNVVDAEISYEDQAIRLKSDWTISGAVSMQAEYYHLETERLWKNAEFYSLDSSTGLIDRFDPLVILHDMEHDGLRVNFVSNHDLPGIGLRSSAGFEVNDISFERPSNFGPGNPNRVDFGVDSDAIDPNNFIPGILSDLTTADALPDTFSEVDQFALFTESQLKFNDQFSIVLGLRYDDVETDYNRVGQAPFEQSVDVLTGRIGAVYDINDDSVLYAQYGTGATHPNNSLVTASASNRQADFIDSEQVEVGIKQLLLGGRLQWNLAWFDIVKNDLVEDNPDSGNPDDLILIPEQTSQGVELGFDFRINDALQAYGNAGILEAETDTGVTPTYVPEKTANLGLTWTPIEHLRLIVYARYLGERFHPSIPIPSYTVMDTTASLSINEQLSIIIKADNVFDERYASMAYYSSTWLVGKPRTFSVTANYRF